MVKVAATSMMAPINRDNAARNELMLLWWIRSLDITKQIQQYRREKRKRDNGDT